MKRRNLLFALSFLFSLAVGAVPAAAEKVITIGFQGPFTGEYAQYGEAFRHGGEMAYDHFMKKGGIPGAKVVIKYADSKSDPKEAINIARMFADDKNLVGVLGDFSSTASMAAAEVYKKEGICQLSPTTSHPDFPLMSKRIFRVTVTQALESPANAKWAIKNLKAKRLAVISIQNDWGVSVANYFEKGVKEGGAELVAKEMFNPGLRDFRAILTKVMGKKPDCIFLGMFYEDGATLLQQRKQLNINLPVFGGGSLYSEKLIELAGDAAEGFRVTTPFLPNSDEPHIKAFVEEYKSRSGKMPNMFGAYAFDAATIMLDAVKKLGSNVTRTSLGDVVSQTKDFPGVTGNTSFDPVTGEVSKSLERMIVKNGKFIADK
jgi:branched-chain amino acid transport system substrate-binding protein